MSELVREWLFDPVMGKIVATVAVLVVVVIVVRVVQRVLRRTITDNDARYRARKLVTFGGYVLAVLVVASIYGNKLGGLTVAFGVAGAGIAFALQEVIASVAGWAAVSVGNFYKPGDRVQLGGIMGDVIDIGILRTTIMECGDWVKGDLYNGRIVRVANSFVFKEPVFNYSGEFPFLWDEIVVPVKYGGDVETARTVLLRVADEVVGEYAEVAAAAWKKLVQNYLIEDAQVHPMVTLVTTDNWLEFTLRYVVDYKKRRITKDRLFTRILEEFNRTSGRVALASATFQLVDAPTLSVRLTSDGPPSAS